MRDEKPPKCGVFTLQFLFIFEQDSHYLDYSAQISWTNITSALSLEKNNKLPGGGESLR